MGMYTGLRAKVLVREEYSKAIEELHENDHDVFGWRNISSSFPNLKEWKEYSRHRFIPFASPYYLPDDWTLIGKKNSYYDKESRIWEFSCSLKNYEEEIDFFVKKILLLVVDRVFYCQSLYEEDSEPIDLMEIYGSKFTKQVFISSSLNNTLWVRGENEEGR